MSLQAGSSGSGDKLFFLGVSEEDVEFDRIQSVLHGGYQQKVGSIELEEEYEVKVAGNDSYMAQVRNDGELVERNYVDSEDPFEDLPE